MREVTDRQAAAMTVIENLQREDVNPMDQASGFRRLIDEFGLTPGQIVDRTGKSRTAVSNSCACCISPTGCRTWCARGKLSAGHAKALLALDGQPEDVMQDFASQAVALSVRETERRIRRFLRSDESDPTIEPGRWLRPKVLEAERDLRRGLSAKVVITRARRTGPHPHPLRRSLRIGAPLHRYHRRRAGDCLPAPSQRIRPDCMNRVREEQYSDSGSVGLVSGHDLGRAAHEEDRRGL